MVRSSIGMENLLRNVFSFFKGVSRPYFLCISTKISSSYFATVPWSTCNALANSVPIWFSILKMAFLHKKEKIRYGEDAGTAYSRQMGKGKPKSGVSRRLKEKGPSPIFPFKFLPIRKRKRDSFLGLGAYLLSTIKEQN